MFIERTPKRGMWLPKNQSEKKDGGVNGLIAVAIDKEKGSQNALKWAIDNLLSRNSTVILIHVKVLAPFLSPSPSLFTLSEYIPYTYYYDYTLVTSNLDYYNTEKC